MVLKASLADECYEFKLRIRVGIRTAKSRAYLITSSAVVSSDDGTLTPSSIKTPKETLNDQAPYALKAEQTSAGLRIIEIG
jgi:hypothetical protein